MLFVKVVMCMFVCLCESVRVLAVLFSKIFEAKRSRINDGINIIIISNAQVQMKTNPNIFFQASENVCEDDPSNLNFRFYRIFDPDHQIGGHASRQTDSRTKPNNTTPVKHPGKAVNIQNNKAKVDTMAATAASPTSTTKVDPNPLVMSPVHKKNSGQMSKAASINQLNGEPRKENAQLFERKSTDSVTTNIVATSTTTTTANDVIADVVKNGVDLCVEDGSIAHL